MIMSNLVNLNYDDFSVCTASMLQNLMEKGEFADVTLVADDQQIKAHKFILSNCSPFFENVLKQNPHESPLIYLKGISFENLQNVIQFVYTGEAIIDKDNLDTFLETGEELSIKFLTTAFLDKPFKSTVLSKTRGDEEEIKKEIIYDTNKELVKSEDMFLFEDNQDIIEKPSKMTDKEYVCKECEYSTENKKSLSKHKKLVHPKETIETIDNKGEKQFSCKECAHISTSQTNLWRHKRSVHLKETFSCDKCGSVMKRKDHLKQHILSVHEGHKYSCDQCDYMGNFPQMVVQHKRKFHV